MVGMLPACSNCLFAHEERPRGIAPNCVAADVAACLTWFVFSPAGDLLLVIDGVNVEGKKPAEVSHMIVGPLGSTIEIILLSKKTGDRMPIKLVRGSQAQAGVGMKLNWCGHNFACHKSKHSCTRRQHTCPHTCTRINTNELVHCHLFCYGTT